jgi:hypothetical protein
MNCPACHSANSSEAHFCLHCGTRLVRLCPQRVRPTAHLQQTPVSMDERVRHALVRGLSVVPLLVPAVARVAEVRRTLSR